MTGGNSAPARFSDRRDLSRRDLAAVNLSTLWHTADGGAHVRPEMLAKASNDPIFIMRFINQNGKD
jgi:hypothetical protein